MTPFDLAFYPTFGAGCLLGTFLAWKASGRGPVGQVLVLLLAFVVIWLSLILGVYWGYGAWQSMPDPPEEAFADGADLAGSVLFGWMPSGLGCLVVWLVAHTVRTLRVRGRDRAAKQV